MVSLASVIRIDYGGTDQLKGSSEVTQVRMDGLYVDLLSY